MVHQQVVPIQTGTRDGRSTAETSMGTVPIVVVEPARQMGSAFQGSLIDTTVGPLAQGGLDKTLGLSVGAGSVRSSANVFDTEPLAELTEHLGFITGTVVGHDAADGDVQPGEPSQGRFQEAGRRNAFFVGHDLGEGGA